MTQYLIAFNDGDMTFPREELPDVANACRAMVQEANEAGVWVFSAGLATHDVVSVVATDGTVTDGPYPESKEHLGGFAVVDVTSHDAALEWAAKIAAACRCAQQVFEVLPRPDWADGRPPENTEYMIAFNDGDMTFPREELPDVAKATVKVSREAEKAGVWVFGAGLATHDVVSVVATDGTVTDGPYPESKEHIGGFAVVDVPSHDAALEWAAKIAAACRCAQQVFEVLPQPSARWDWAREEQEKA
jgi:hypothetical protein